MTSIRWIAFLLLMATLLAMLVGCIPYDKNWRKFRTLDNDEIYSFEIDDTNYFWYSEKLSYGEWVKGEERVLLTMTFTRGYRYEPETDCTLRFHDDYGSCMAEMTLHMDTYTNLKTNYHSSRCKGTDAPIIYMEQHRPLIEGLLDGVEFIEKRIRKVDVDVGEFAPVQQSMISFLNRTESSPVYMCEELGIWFEFYVNIRPDQISDLLYIAGKMLVEEEWIAIDLYTTSDDMLTIYPDDGYAKGAELGVYFVCQDENGFYLLDKATGETGRLVEITLEADPRRDEPLFKMLLPTDAEGNHYLLVCENLGFSFDTATKKGEWKIGTESVPIHVEISYWGLLTVYSESAEQSIKLLHCAFVEMIDENTSRYQVHYAVNHLPFTEVILTKQPIANKGN